jgi:hypothetical protein
MPDWRASIRTPPGQDGLADLSGLTVSDDLTTLDGFAALDGGVGWMNRDGRVTLGGLASRDGRVHLSRLVSPPGLEDPG